MDNRPSIILVALTLAPTIKVSLLMLKVFLPLSLVTLWLRQSGMLDLLAPGFAPFMSLMGLPGEAAITLLVGFTNSIYAALATTAAMDLTARQITILAVVLGLAHSLFIETGILAKLRMATVRIAFFRILVGIAAGLALNAIMPEIGTPMVKPVVAEQAFSWLEALLQIGYLSIQIVVVIFIMTVAFELLSCWKGAGRFRARLGFVRTAVGISDQAIGPWIAGFIVGITYGAALLYQFNEKERLSHKDTCLITVFFCLSHAIIEDTLLFVVLGGHLWWIILSRTILAVLVVRFLAMGDLYRHFLWIGLPKEPGGVMG